MSGSVVVEHLLILAVALLADRLLGDPDWLWRRLPHPVVLFGLAIDFVDSRWNREHDPETVRRGRGVAAIVGLLVLTVVLGAMVAAVLDRLGPLGLGIEVVLVSILLAQRSLADHVMAVASALRRDGISGGRVAVSRIVGRDPDTLDAAGICRAAIESLAENFSDGVVAPAFWYALLGLPGLLAYKILNTADSMIGHKNTRYRSFGWAAARLDDLANWPAARLSAGIIAAAALVKHGRAAARRAVGSVLRDAGLHRSPNAGWPECAMAGALDLSLAGERRYNGKLVREPRLNPAGRHAANVADIEAATALFKTACTILVFVVVLLSIAAATIS